MIVKTKTIFGVLTGVCILALVSTGVFFYLWQAKSGEAITTKEQADAANSEISDLKKQLANVAKADTAKNTPGPNGTDTPSQPVQSPSSEELFIKNTVAAYVHAQVGSEAAVLDVKITKQSGNFARVSVSTGEAGYACVLKKSDNIWIIIFCGQARPLQNDLERWGVPANMLEGL